MKRKVAIYARVSTEHEAQLSALACLPISLLIGIVLMNLVYRIEKKKIKNKQNKL